MARKSNQLPSSLELLLDTMCNTFGGIMFIAIALVIVTQVSSKMLEKAMTYVPTPEERQQVREELADCQTALLELEQQRLIQQLEKRGLPPEALALVRKILETRQQNAALLPELDALNQENLNAQLAYSEEAENTRAAEEKNAELEEKFQTLQANKRLAQAAQEQAKQQEATAQEQLEKLKKQAKNARPAQVLTFSMEHETSARGEFAVFLIRGRIYRDDSSEVYQKPIRDDGRVVQISPRGTGHGCTTYELDNLFSPIEMAGRYVHIWVDNSSFPSLCFLRNYLRNRHIGTSWRYTDDFVFYMGSNFQRGVSQ